MKAIDRASVSESMTYLGNSRAHIGSQVFDVASYRKAMSAIAPFLK